MAGLISAAQADTIVAFEAQRSRPWLLWSIAGLGAFAIAVGMLAVVASNWQEIGPRAKIAVDLLAGGGLAFAAYRARKRGQPLAFEAAGCCSGGPAYITD